MAQRGLELMSEFRYLGDRNRGKLEGEYLPNDDITNENRYLARLGHAVDARPRLACDARRSRRLRHATTSRISTAASRRPARPISSGSSTFEYFDNIWSVLARFQDYQTLDESLTGDRKTLQARAAGRRQRLRAGRACSASTGASTASVSVFERSVGTDRLAAAPEPGRRAAVALPGLLAGARGGAGAHGVQHRESGARRRLTGRAGPRRSQRGSRHRSSSAAPAAAPGWLQTLEPRVAVRAHSVPAAGRPARLRHHRARFQPGAAVPREPLPRLRPARRHRPDQHRAHQPRSSTRATAPSSSPPPSVSRATSAPRTSPCPAARPSDSSSSDWLAELGVNFWDHWKMDLGWQWDADGGQSQRSQVTPAVPPRRPARLRTWPTGTAATASRKSTPRPHGPLTDRWSAVGALRLLDPGQPVARDLRRPGVPDLLLGPAAGLPALPRESHGRVGQRRRRCS